jgi:hypothetical protein
VKGVSHMLAQCLPLVIQVATQSHQQLSRLERVVVVLIQEDPGLHPAQDRVQLRVIAMQRPVLPPLPSQEGCGLPVPLHTPRRSCQGSQVRQLQPPLAAVASLQQAGDTQDIAGEGPVIGEAPQEIGG